MAEDKTAIPLVPTVPLDKTMEAIMGFVKANTSDLLGAPADISYAINKLTSKNAEPAKPEFGSDYFRKIFFGPAGVETKSLTEVAGSLVSPGGVAGVGKAMIVGAIPKLAISGVSAKSAARILTELDKLQTSEEAVRFFQETGVFRGIEDAQKAAISDAAATLNKKPFSRIIDEKGNINTVLAVDTKLGNLLDHPELYKLYPKLSEVKVKSDAGMNINAASFDPKTQTITLGPQASADMAMSSTLHEVQHIVQDYEGFAFGTSPNAQREFKAVELTQQRLDRLRKLREEGNPHAIKAAEMLNADTRNAFQKYKKNPGESEARFTESTMGLSQSELNARIEDVLKNPLPTSFWDK